MTISGDRVSTISSYLASIASMSSGSRSRSFRRSNSALILKNLSIEADSHSNSVRTLALFTPCSVHLRIPSISPCTAWCSFLINVVFSLGVTCFSQRRSMSRYGTSSISSLELAHPGLQHLLRNLHQTIDQCDMRFRLVDGPRNLTCRKPQNANHSFWDRLPPLAISRGSNPCRVSLRSSYIPNLALWRRDQANRAS